MQPSPATTTLPHIDYRWVFAASLLVSAWLIAMDPLINRDAIIYLRAADAYLAQGFAASQQEFGRPFLSIAMSLLHQLTGMSTLWAGLLLVSLAYAVMCTGFVATVHTLGGDRRVQWLAAALVLSHPMLNHTRSAIMRDPIYWSMLILALRELLLYLRQPSLLHQARWTLYVLVGALFRFEGVFFALLSPFALLFCRELQGRHLHCLRLLLPQVLAITAIGTGVWWYLLQHGEDARLFPAIQLYLDRLVALPAGFAETAAATGNQMLQFTSREDAGIALLAGLTAVLLLNLCRAITWPWLAMLVWGRLRGLIGRLRRDDNTIIIAHAGIGLAYLSLFMLLKYFMLERYSNQVVLFLLLYLPFILGALWTRGGWRKALVLVLLLGMSADTLHTNDGDKRFVRDATEWVRDNTPPRSSIASNEKYIAYFSKRDFNWESALGKTFELDELLSEQRNWRRVDYLVVHLRRNQEAQWQVFLEKNHLVELRSFDSDSRRKGRVAIVAVGGKR